MNALVSPLQGFTWYFLGWTGTGATFSSPSNYETGVRFDQSDATVNANYKAHLGSSVSSASGSNSQRTMISVRDGALSNKMLIANQYFLAYESGGEVWHSTSLDQGGTWSAEERVSAGSGDFGAPSISVHTKYNHLFDVYTVYRKQSGSYRDIVFRVKDDGTWTNPVTISAPSTISSGVNTRPVIARTIDTDGVTPVLAALWEANSGIQLRKAVYVWNGTWKWYWYDPPYYVADPGSRNPSISSTNLQGLEYSPYLYFSYDKGGDIVVSTYWPVGSQSSASVPASLAPNSFGAQIVAESSSDDYCLHSIHVAWETIAGNESLMPIEQHSVMYQGFINCGWTAAHQFANSSVGGNRRPTITMNSSGLVMAWDDGVNTYRATSVNGVKWVLDSPYSGVRHPNLAGPGTDGLPDNAKFVATSNSGPAYKLRFNQGATAPSVALREEYSRRVQGAALPSIDGWHVDNDSGHFSIELAPIQLKLTDGSNVSVDFISGDDTSRLDETNAWKQLSTEPILLTSNIDSIIIDANIQSNRIGRVIGAGRTNARLGFDVISVADGTVLRKIGVDRLFDRDTTSAFRLKGRLAGLGSRRVIIRPRVEGLGGKTERVAYTMVHVHKIINDSQMSTQLATATTQQQEVAALPSLYMLHQNYPNPFNPSTQFSFDLPEAGNVSLAIFDVLGRQIAELVNSSREAGYHTVTWNAADQASGVYLARFSVTSGNGERVYSTINKLILMK